MSGAFFYYFFGKILDRFLGLFRTRLQKQILGHTEQGDIYGQLVKLFAIFRRTLTDNSFQNLFAKYYNEEKKIGKQKEFSGFVLLSIGSLFLLLSLVISLIPIKFLIGINTTQKYLIYFAPVSFLIFVFTFFKSICECEKLYLLSGFSQSFGNTWFIGAILVCAYFQSTGIYVFIFGSLIYSLVQCFYFLPHVWNKIALRLYTNWNFFTDFLKIQINCLTSISELFIGFIVSQWQGAISQLDNAHKVLQFLFSILVDSIISSVINKIGKEGFEVILLFHTVAIPTSIFIFFKTSLVCWLLDAKQDLIFYRIMKILCISFYPMIMNRAITVFLIQEKKINRTFVSSFIGSIIYVLLSLSVVKWAQNISFLSGANGLAWVSTFIVFLQFLWNIFQLPFSSYFLKNFLNIILTNIIALATIYGLLKINNIYISMFLMCINFVFLLNILQRIFFSLFDIDKTEVNLFLLFFPICAIFLPLVFYFQLFKIQILIYCLFNYYIYLEWWKKYLSVLL